MYLHPTITDTEAQDIISNHIENNIPFSFTRIGDGEIYLLNNNAPRFLIEKICKLFNIDETQYQQFRNDFLNNILFPVLKETNMLGILDKKNPICNKLKYNENTWSIKKDILKKYRHINDLLVCDHQLSRNAIFGNPYEFKKILNGKPITILTPNTSILTSNISDILQADVNVHITTNDRSHILNICDNIKTDIVLFGTSLLGKDIGIRMKNMNKIALDYGSTLDGWAGLCTKPWFKSGQIQEHCMIKQ